MTVSARRPTSTQPTGLWPVQGLILAMVGLAAIVHLVLIGDRPPLDVPLQVPWWLLAAGFAVTGMLVTHITVRTQSHTLTLIEVPLVLGLALAAPSALIIGRLIGAALAIWLHRRLPPIKLIFNLALAYLETAVAIVVYRFVLGSSSPVDPPGWAAAFVAVLAVQLLGLSAVRTVLRITDAPRPQQATATAIVSTTLALTSAVVGLTGLVLVWTDSRLGLLLVILTGALYNLTKSSVVWQQRTTAIREVSKLASRLGGLERDDLLRQSLMNSRDLLRAQAAEVVLTGDGGAGQVIQITPDDDVIIRPATGENEAWMRPILSASTERQIPAQEDYLQDRGYQLGMVTAIPGREGPIGLLAVFDRVGPRPRFEEADRELLEAIAAYTGLALR